MRILHLVAGSLTSGAARGAYWLHQAQREIGIDSILLRNGNDKIKDWSVIDHRSIPLLKYQNAISSRIKNIPVHFYPRREQRIFSTGFEGVNFTRLPAYKNADIIHLHWINGLVAIHILKKVNKPIVWTIRDMWPLTGGCHYSINCDNYKSGCGQCPQLKSNHIYDLSKLVVFNKKKYIPNHLQVVGISNWLSNCASSSIIFSKFPVTTISNNIDTRSFKPIDKDIARNVLSLPHDKQILLVGAQRLTNFYKGFDLFLEAMDKIKDRDIHIVTFGNIEDDIMNKYKNRHTNLGFLSDTIAMCLAYSAADVFVAPSIMEAFGKTLAEAQACGTPVVCFDATGPKDIIEHKVTGYKAKPYDSFDLANGIRWVFEQSEKESKIMRLDSRKRAVNLFDSQVIAEKYKDLYNELLK